MRKLAILVAFLLCITPAFAYEEFNSNPHFSSLTGYVIGDYGTTEYSCWLFFTCLSSETIFNSTWSNSSLGGNSAGKIILTNNNFTGYNSYLEVAPLTTDNFYHSNNISENEDVKNSEGLLHVPKDYQPVVTIRLRINDTTGLTTANLYVAGTYSHLYNILPNITNNSVRNLTFVLPSALANSTYKAYLVLIWSPLAGNTTVEIGEFNFYTLDINEPRDSWTSNVTYEKIRYCGDNSVHERNFSYGNGTQFVFARTADNLPCAALKIGNVTIARTPSCSYDPVVSYSACQSNLSNAEMIIMRDGYYIYQGSGVPTEFYMEKLSLLSSKITVFRPAFGSNNVGIAFNGVELTWLNTSKMVNNESGSSTNISSVIRRTISLLPYLNSSTPAGTGWTLCQSAQAKSNCFPFQNFFDFNGINCLANFGLTCDAATNYQYYINPDCSIAANSTTYCGEWGCNANYSACDFGNIGSFCLADNISYTTTDINGTFSYHSCYPDFCFQANATGISCLDQAAYDAAQADANTTSSLNPLINPVNYFASYIGAAFGLGGVENLMFSQPLFAILCSLAASIGAMFWAMKINPEIHGEKILTIMFVGLLFVFSIAMQNIILWGLTALMAVIAAAMLSGALGNIFGGGK